MSVDSIIFPHLHMAFQQVGSHASVFGISIAYYGIIISLGMVIAGAFVLYDANLHGKSQDDYLDVMIYGLIFGVIGARLYYVFFSWDYYKDNLLSIFNLRQGGLAIYGGIIAGIIAAIIVCKIKKLDFLEVADSVSFGLIIGQFFGRFGNFFNREAFGGYTDNLFAMLLPLSSVRSMDDVTLQMMEHAKTIDGVTFISVHPTFLYESLWSLGIFLILFFYRRIKKFRGEIFFMYLMLYGLGRFWMEHLRTDQLKILHTNIPVSQVVAAVAILISGIYLLYHYHKLHQEKEHRNQ